jgi:hypothetical protein
MSHMLLCSQEHGQDKFSSHFDTIFLLIPSFIQTPRSPKSSSIQLLWGTYVHFIFAPGMQHVCHKPFTPCQEAWQQWCQNTYHGMSNTFHAHSTEKNGSSAESKLTMQCLQHSVHIVLRSMHNSVVSTLTVPCSVFRIEANFDRTV